MFLHTLLSYVVVALGPTAFSFGQAHSVTMTVEDGAGAAVASAQVVISCEARLESGQARGLQLNQATDESGRAFFSLRNDARCSVSVSASGFADLRYPLDGEQAAITLRLLPATAKQEVTVFADAAAVESSTPVAQTILSERQIAAIPVFHRATGFTDLLTRTTPGVAADANGFAHPLGEHADTSISLDGQPMTDQQAKVFSNQLDPAIIQTLVATTGAPAAEFGDKTSLVVSITTRSGLGQRRGGTLSSEYGSFGTRAVNLAAGAGSRRWGSFLALNANGSGRFLDTPEFRPIHAQGNSEGGFDRVDWQPDAANFFHLNLGLGRSWFQTPNSYDAERAQQDQRSQIRNANLAFGWNHVFAPSLLTAFTPFYRHDRAEYFPSADPLADQTATLSQDRTLTNTGFRLETVYATKNHTLKAGGTYWHTLLHERFSVALTDPLYNAVCTDAAGSPVAAGAVRDLVECAAEGLRENPGFLRDLLPYDLTRGGALYRFDDRADIVETALYVQDEIRWGNWMLSPGLRYDVYDGLSRGRQVQPRLGLGYRVPAVSQWLRGWNSSLRPLLRASYARLYETPYTENLIFASASAASAASANGSLAKDAGANPFASFRVDPIKPGTRNQFNVGLHQAFGRHLSLDSDYYWKFTNTAFDFATLFNTPITFSVAWRKSKIDGLALRVNLVDLHGLTAYSVMGHVRSRFFTPQSGGLIFSSVPVSPVFRIDHGEEFEQTTNVRYQLAEGVARKRRPWVTAVWRYNSGLALPDTVPTYFDALKLSADEQAQMGLHCGGDFATQGRAIRSCGAAVFGAARVRIPSYGTEDEDRNPVRVAPRTLFDLAIGEDSVIKLERATIGVHLSVMNVTNRIALYNFLSTFSGTHFVAPRSVLVGVEVKF